ncbi:MAG TPA: chemotaxis protein CheA [Terriglobales bacterium]|nr:chemotaxis protein CheA [Terriglobales bacterium]
MSFFSEERAAELRDLFFESAQELLQTLNEQGLELEKSPADAEVVRGIRRTVHTIKGDSAACGFKELSDLAHELEDVLKPELAVSSGNSLAELVLSAADMFDAMLAAYRGKMQPPKPDPLRAMIGRLLSVPSSSTGSNELRPQFQWSEYDRLAMTGAQSAGKSVFNVAIALDHSAPMRAAALQLVLNVISECGTVLGRYPDEIPADGSVDFIEVALATHLSAADIKQKCSIPTAVEKIVIEPWTPDVQTMETISADHDVLGLEQAVPAPVASEPVTELDEALAVAAHAPASETKAASIPKPKSAEFAAAENVLRVDADRIDTVMNLVGELIIGKSMLYQTINEFGKRYPKDPLRNRFTDAMSKQAQVLNALQRSVMKIRMVPVDQLFRRFPRVLRDASKTCGKEVELVMIGQDTDLDKGILDTLAEPLTHLLRNAVDHGIESPTERTAMGKSPQGFVKLNAYHQANHVVIEISDDGRGIDPEKVVAKAIERGTITADDATRMTETQKLELIFESGLSTADEVTSISGRGVGMDVVRSVVARLKGSVQIISNVGKGTTFRLTLPLTLAIIKALLFSVGEQYYAVPLNTVVEITRAHYDQVHKVDNCEVLRLREEIITLTRLSRLMPETNEASISKFFVVVVGLGDRKFGLIVDKLVGEDELVIKAMDDQLVATDLVSGASILGDGTVVLILNIPALVDRVAFVRMPVAGPPLISQAEGVGASL